MAGEQTWTDSALVLPRPFTTVTRTHGVSDEGPLSLGVPARDVRRGRSFPVLIVGGRRSRGPSRVSDPPWVTGPGNRPGVRRDSADLQAPGTSTPPPRLQDLRFQVGSVQPRVGPDRQPTSVEGDRGKRPAPDVPSVPRRVSVVRGVRHADGGEFGRVELYLDQRLVSTGVVVPEPRRDLEERVVVSEEFPPRRD